MCNKFTEPHNNETCFIRNCTVSDNDNSIYADLIVKFKKAFNELNQFGVKTETDDDFEEDLIIADVYLNASNTQLEDSLRWKFESPVLKRGKRISLLDDPLKTNQTVLENKNSKEIPESEVNLNLSEKLKVEEGELVEKSEELIYEIQDVLSNNQTIINLNFNISNEKSENDSRLFNDTIDQVFNGNETTNTSEPYFESNTTTSSMFDHYNTTGSNLTLSSNQTNTNIHEVQTENIEFAWVTGEFSPVFTYFSAFNEPITFI